MKLSRTSLLAMLAVSGCLLFSPASRAISLYSLSESVSASVGSISDSVHGSSKALHVAAGDYKVVDVASADDKPGQARLTLQAAGDAQAAPFYLFVPQADARQAALARGQTVTASQRAYGLDFAKTGDSAPFALVLDQSWLQELQPRVVS
ncbi:hypothetical protein [Vogesella sp. LIG4]|uniref:hypothetical protein n=1 Tax=Vogesella sp. LIG4 TaxID=1192162 RepID=UPI00081FAD42|nr:hypothetical protein [Vogesella sp. LIG4]SCK04948.1 hypothetical protein PSELUDRAFT_0039 [Vogesella sp. LIG4]